MSKPTRYSRIDRFRKRTPISSPLRVGALLRRQTHIQKQLQKHATLAAQALRRCVELETWIRETTAGLEFAEIPSGCCMCGDAMAGHASALTCGHVAVDSGEYYLSELTKAAAQLLAKPMVDAPADKPYSYLQMQQQINHGLWQLKQRDRRLVDLEKRLAAAEKELFLQTARGEPYEEVR